MFDLHQMLIFKGLRVREIYPKITPKSQKIYEQQCLEMLCFLYSFFSRFSFDWVSIFGSILELRRPLWSHRNRLFSGNGSKVVSKKPFGSIWEPKVNSKTPFGSILKPCGSILDGFWEVWGRFLEGFGAQPSAQKHAVESLSQVGGIGRKAPTIIILQKCKPFEQTMH